MPHSRYSDHRYTDHGTAAANLLHEKFHEIVARWEVRTRSYLPAASARTHEELIDSIPYFLHGLIEALSEHGEEIETGEAGHTFRKHGVQRASFPDFTLNQILSEYAILRDVLFEVLEERAPLPHKERTIVLHSVDFGLKECCAEFTRVKSAQLKAGLLHMEEAHLRDHQIIESIGDPFAAFDYEARFTYLNEAAAKLLGRNREEVLNQSLWDVIPSDLAPRLKEACQECLHDHAAHTVEFFDSNRGYHGIVRIYPSRNGFSLWFVSTEENALKALANTTPSATAHKH